jgi:cobalamin biosynthesis protein CobD/CbiB
VRLAVVLDLVPEAAANRCHPVSWIGRLLVVSAAGVSLIAAVMRLRLSR